MTEEIVLLEKKEKIKHGLNLIDSWCLLPDETLVCGFGYNNKYAFTRWDATQKKILATSVISELTNFYRDESHLLPLSNHRVLSVFVNLREEIIVNEWDYETNALLKQAKCIDNDVWKIISIHALENDRFLIKSVKIDEAFGGWFTMYDANHGTSIKFNVVRDGIELDNFPCFPKYYFLEEKDGDRLSFATEFGSYVEGSWKKMVQDLDSNRKIFVRGYSYECFEVQMVSTKSIQYELFLNNNTLNSVQILSNGDLLFVDDALNIFSIDRTKESVARINYQSIPCNIHCLMELRSGLILGQSDDNSTIFVWNRKGELLRRQFLSLSGRIKESNSGSLIYMGAIEFIKWRPIYSEENLVNRCCNAFTGFVQREISNAIKNDNLDEGIQVRETDLELRVREKFLELLKTILPHELCQLIRFFAYNVRQKKLK